MNEQSRNIWNDHAEHRRPFKLDDFSDSNLASHDGIYDLTPPSNKAYVCLALADGDARKCDQQNVYFDADAKSTICPICLGETRTARLISNGTDRGETEPVCLTCVRKSNAFFFYKARYDTVAVYGYMKMFPTKRCRVGGCHRLIPTSPALTACCLEHLSNVEIPFCLDISTDTKLERVFVCTLSFPACLIRKIQAEIQIGEMTVYKSGELESIASWDSLDAELDYEVRESFYDELVTLLVKTEAIQEYFIFKRIDSTYKKVSMFIAPTEKYLQLPNHKLYQYDGRYIFWFNLDNSTNQIISLVGSPGL